MGCLYLKVFILEGLYITGILVSRWGSFILVYHCFSAGSFRHNIAGRERVAISVGSFTPIRRKTQDCLAAVVGQLAAEVLELAEEAASDSKKLSLISRHFELARGVEHTPVQRFRCTRRCTAQHPGGDSSLSTR